MGHNKLPFSRKTERKIEKIGSVILINQIIENLMIKINNKMKG